MATTEKVKILTSLAVNRFINWGNEIFIKCHLLVPGIDILIVSQQSHTVISYSEFITFSGIRSINLSFGTKLYTSNAFLILVIFIYYVLNLRVIECDLSNFEQQMKNFLTLLLPVNLKITKTHCQ